MTIGDIAEAAALAGADKPLGDPHLDCLFSVVQCAVYYRFLYHLVRRLKPRFVVELGVEFGRSTAHIAAASPDCALLSIDRDISRADACLRYPNVELHCGDSTDPEVLIEIPKESVDICFVDTDHNCAQVMKEYDAWLPKMKHDGVMLFDDISENSSMVEAWEILKTKGPSVSLPHLHHSGFGAVIV